MSETLMPKQSYIAIDGKEYIIYPMKLKDYGKVDRLFSLINDEYLFLNLPFPMVDEKGSPMLNKNGQQMLDFKAYNAMCELFEMALRIPKKEVMNVVDVSNGVVILDEFRNISGLKKKDTEQSDESSDSERQFDRLIASLIQHTSETRETIMEYTIPQLEALSIALSENNDDSKEKEDEGKSFEEGCDTGVDAVNSLKQLGFI